MSTACSPETGLVVPKPQPMAEPRRELFPQELALSIKEEQQLLPLASENTFGVQTPAQIATSGTPFRPSTHAAMGKRKAEWSLNPSDGSHQQTEQDQPSLQSEQGERRSPPIQPHLAASSQNGPSHAAGVCTPPAL